MFKNRIVSWKQWWNQKKERGQQTCITHRTMNWASSVELRKYFSCLPVAPWSRCVVMIVAICAHPISISPWLGSAMQSRKYYNIIEEFVSQSHGTTWCMLYVHVQKLGSYYIYPHSVRLERVLDLVFMLNFQYSKWFIILQHISFKLLPLQPNWLSGVIY